MGMDILSNSTNMPYIIYLHEGTLSGPGYQTIQLHRGKYADCYAIMTFRNNNICEI